MLASEIVRDVEQALAVEEPARGLHLVDHLLRSFPAHLRARTLRAKALLALGKRDEAAGDAATVLSADLLNVEAMLVSAKLAEVRGDLHQSHALIGRAASVDSGHGEVRQAVADSVAMLPRDLAALGFAYLNSNWPDLAEREFRLALGRDPARVDLRIALAESLWRQGCFEEARPECRIVLDHHPHCLRATLMMAHILAEQGRTAHGMEMLERAGEMDPEYEVADELYARATLSRMSLPLPPFLPEPPAFPVDLVSAVDESQDGESDEADSDDEAGAEGTGGASADVFPTVEEMGADSEGEEGQSAKVADAPDLEAGDQTGSVDVSAPGSHIDLDPDLGDEILGADDVSVGVSETAPAIEFSAGWPAEKGGRAAADDVDESETTSAMSPTSERAAESETAELEEKLSEAADNSPEYDRAEEDTNERAEVEPAEEFAGANAEDETNNIDAAEPHADISIDDEHPIDSPSTVELNPKSEVPSGEGGDEPRAESDEADGAEPVDTFGGPAVLDLGRVGSWDAVVDALEEMLAGGELEPVAGLIEELTNLSGFPLLIWRLLGDSYMKSNLPQMASEAYVRAVQGRTE